jgi:hypothetical protein
MNDRINELFGQALDQAVPETWTTLTPAQLSKLKDKFAELIVRECYGEVLCQLYDYNPSSNEQFNLGHETGLKLAVSKIKEHFGVEE